MVNLPPFHFPQGDADHGVQAHGQVLVEDKMKVQYLRWR